MSSNHCFGPQPIRTQQCQTPCPTDTDASKLQFSLRLYQGRGNGTHCQSHAGVRMSSNHCFGPQPIRTQQCQTPCPTDTDASKLQFSLRLYQVRGNGKHCPSHTGVRMSSNHCFGPQPIRTQQCQTPCPTDTDASKLQFSLRLYQVRGNGKHCPSHTGVRMSSNHCFGPQPIRTQQCQTPCPTDTDASKLQFSLRLYQVRGNGKHCPSHTGVRMSSNHCFGPQPIRTQQCQTPCPTDTDASKLQFSLRLYQVRGNGKHCPSHTGVRMSSNHCFGPQPIRTQQCQTPCPTDTDASKLQFSLRLYQVRGNGKHCPSHTGVRMSSNHCFGPQPIRTQQCQTPCPTDTDASKLQFSLRLYQVRGNGKHCPSHTGVRMSSNHCFGPQPIRTQQCQTPCPTDTDASKLQITFRGTPNQKLACFVLHLKIIEM